MLNLLVLSSCAILFRNYWKSTILTAFLLNPACWAMENDGISEPKPSPRARSDSQAERDDLVDLLLDDSANVQFFPSPPTKKREESDEEDVEGLVTDLTAPLEESQQKSTIVTPPEKPSSSSPFKEYLSSLSPETRKGYIQALASSPRGSLGEQDSEDLALAEELRKHPAKSRNLSLNLTRVSSGSVESPRNSSGERKSSFSSRRSSSARSAQDSPKNSPSGNSPKGPFAFIIEKVQRKKDSPREAPQRISQENGAEIGAFTPPGKENE